MAVYLQRKLLLQISPYVDSKEMIIVTGMRRVGKSSLLQMLFDSVESKNKIMFDIENPVNRDIFSERDFNNIIKNLSDAGLSPDERMYVFLDEIQSFPEIVKALKYLYDHFGIKFFLTGSSSFYLKNLFPESLSGRKFEFELYPLDFEEFLYFKGTINTVDWVRTGFAEKQNSRYLYEKRIRLYDEYLQYGGFPQVVLAENADLKKKYLLDIYKSYFQTDLLQLSNMRNVNIIKDLIVLLTARVGNKVDISRLTSELGLSRETMYNYLAFLSGSYMFHFVSRYGKSPDKEISSLKKVYICDLGLASQLKRISEGQIIENAVFLNLKKYGTVNYYHDKSQKEIDFILPDHNLAIEVKRNAIQTDITRLKTFSAKAGFNRYVVCTYKYSDMDKTIVACFI